MGIFSSIGKALFGDPTDDIRRGEKAALAQQQKALDYQMRLDAPLVGYRNQALGGLSDYYMGGPQAQQSFYDTAMQSPAYQNLINIGEEAVLRNAAVTGGLRGGGTQQALAQNSQNILQGLVNQNLQGLQGFANPSLNTANITNTYGNMGNIQQQSHIAQGQADQSAAGQLLGGITGGLGLASGLGWKPFGG